MKNKDKKLKQINNKIISLNNILNNSKIEFSKQKTKKTGWIATKVNENGEPIIDNNNHLNN